MALGDFIGNFSELVASLPVEVADKVLGLVLVLKALGIAAIIYVIYVIAMGLFTYHRMKKVDEIERTAAAINKKINSMDKKLDMLLKRKKKN